MRTGETPDEAAARVQAVEEYNDREKVAAALRKQKRVAAAAVAEGAEEGAEGEQLSQYEQQRARNIRKNKEVMHALGLGSAPNPAPAASGAGSSSEHALLGEQEQEQQHGAVAWDPVAMMHANRAAAAAAAAAAVVAAAVANLAELDDDVEMTNVPTDGVRYNY